MMNWTPARRGQLQHPIDHNLVMYRINHGLLAVSSHSHAVCLLSLKQGKTTDCQSNSTFRHKTAVLAIGDDCVLAIGDDCVWNNGLWHHHIYEPL